MRTFLKRVAPVWLVRYARNARKWLHHRGWRGIFSLLKVTTKEALRIRERLDYPSKDILIEVSTSTELLRANACRKEPETVAWIEKNIKAGDILYDVGANVGAYSFVASALTDGACHVYAFEPSSSTFASLCRNIFLNDFAQSITPLQVALSDKTEVASFAYADIDPGTSQHAVIHKKNVASSEEGGAVHDILSYRLDDLVAAFSLPLPNHIKIDVDGAEYSVVLGAKRTLAQTDVRSLLIEIDERIDSEGKTVAILKECGLSLHSKHSRGGSKTLFNYIFTREQ